jgi:hypothetical protein
MGLHLGDEQEDHRPGGSSSLGYRHQQKVCEPLRLVFSANVRYGRVPVTISGGPASPEIKVLPKHKKNADIGEKKTVYTSAILVEQEDAISFDDQEEVSCFLELLQVVWFR